MYFSNTTILAILTLPFFPATTNAAGLRKLSDAHSSCGQAEPCKSNACSCNYEMCDVLNTNLCLNNDNACQINPRYYFCPCNQHSDCDTGRCDFNGGTNNRECLSPEPLGNACNEDHDCDSQICNAGICSEQRTATCTSNSDCDSGRCDNGGCLPKLQNNEYCDEDSDCFSNVCNDGICNDIRTCSSNSDCASGRCEDGDCQDKLPNGCDCDENSDCQSGRCDGICKNKKSFGSNCNENSDCKSGNCSNFGFGKGKCW